MLPNIRVRVIDKNVARGACYLKKGRVVDVVRPGYADVEMEDGGKLVEVGSS